jgi:hypothetical protein
LKIRYKQDLYTISAVLNHYDWYFYTNEDGNFVIPVKNIDEIEALHDSLGAYLIFFPMEIPGEVIIPC